MALNIGNINFGIDANTSGLKKAITQLEKFQAKNNRIAAQQVAAANRVRSAIGKKDAVAVKGAQAATQANSKRIAALSRQESAVKKAFQATLRLQQAQRKAGVPPVQIGRQTQAFRRLTGAMTSGTLTVRQFTQAQDAFAAATGRGSRALTKFNAAAKSREAGKLTNVLRNLESSAVLAVGPLSGIGARIRSLGAIAGRSNLAIVALAAGVTAAAVAFFKLAQGAIAAGRVFESSMARFKAASGSIEVARKQMSFVIQTAQSLGLRIDVSAKAFSRLSAAARGTSLEGIGVRKVFLAVSKAAAALRLGQGEVEGAFRAIEQIMSKGSVQAEELRGQLGERLPGAFRLAAESMGVTTAALGEMLKAGEVLADEFLPKFAVALEKAFGQAALDNVNSFQGSMNLLANEGLLFSKAFNEAFGVSKIFISGIQTITAAIKVLRKNLSTMLATVGAAIAGMAVLFGPKIIGGVIALTKAIKGAALAMLGFNLIAAANPLGLALRTIVLLVAAIGAAIAAFFGLKSAIDDNIQSIEDVDSALKEMEDAGLVAAGKLSSEFKSLNDDIKDVGKEIRISAEVLGFAARMGDSFASLLRIRFETLLAVEKANTDELKALSITLAKIGFKPASEDIEEVAIALFRATVHMNNLKIAEDKLTSSQEALRDGLGQLALILRRNQELAKGLAAVDYFDDVTKSVEEFNAIIAAGTDDMALRIRLEAVYRAALIERIALEKAIEAAKKASKEAARIRKLQNGILNAVAAIEKMRKSNKALAAGPDSFEYFQKVEGPLDRFNLALLKAGASTELAKILAKQYKDQLILMFEATDRFARAADQMAKAVVNSFEDIIMKGGSVKDMLKDLARELFRVLLRATFLDPLIASLSGIFKPFTAALFPGSTAEAAGAVTGQHGGSWKIGGSGGGDRATVFARPGEIVDISTPSQAASGGRGGGNITVQINAPGADAGTIARIKEIVRVEMVPQIIQASSDSTLTKLRRPKFA